MQRSRNQQRSHTRSNKQKPIAQPQRAVKTNNKKLQKHAMKNMKNSAMVSVKRSFNAPADEAEPSEYDNWTDEEKAVYNKWIFAKTKPVYSKVLAALFVTYGVCPPPKDKQFPGDNSSTIVLDALLNHGLIRPVDDVRAPFDSEKEESVTQLWEIITKTGILPQQLTAKYKPGTVNPNLHFVEGVYKTDPYQTASDAKAGEEMLDEAGNPFCPVDIILDACQQSGLYDLQYFTMKPEDNELWLPYRPKDENFDEFKKVKIAHAIHGEDSEVYNASVYWMQESIPADEGQITLERLLDVLGHIYREDVIGTLNEDEEVLYYEAIENGHNSVDHLNLIQDVIWRCSMQQNIYQAYMSKVDVAEFDYSLLNLPDMYQVAVEEAVEPTSSLQTVGHVEM